MKVANSGAEGTTNWFFFLVRIETCIRWPFLLTQLRHYCTLNPTTVVVPDPKGDGIAEIIETNGVSVQCWVLLASTSAIGYTSILKRTTRRLKNSPYLMWHQPISNCDNKLRHYRHKQCYQQHQLLFFRSLIDTGNCPDLLCRRCHEVTTCTTAKSWCTYTDPMWLVQRLRIFWAISRMRLRLIKVTSPPIDTTTQVETSPRSVYEPCTIKVHLGAVVKRIDFSYWFERNTWLRWVSYPQCGISHTEKIRMPSQSQAEIRPSVSGYKRSIACVKRSLDTRYERNTSSSEIFAFVIRSQNDYVTLSVEWSRHQQTWTTVSRCHGELAHFSNTDARGIT